MGCVSPKPTSLSASKYIEQVRRPIQANTKVDSQPTKVIPIQQKAICLSDLASSIEEKTSERPQWQVTPVTVQSEIKVRDKIPDQSTVNIVYSSDAGDKLHEQRAVKAKANDTKDIIYEEQEFKLSKNPIPSVYRLETTAIVQQGNEKVKAVAQDNLQETGKDTIVLRRITSDISQKFTAFPPEQIVDLSFDFKIRKVMIDPSFGSMEKI